MALKKELSFIHVFSIAAGAMISSGIFILPGLAFDKAGPAVFLSYFLAGIMAVIGVMSIIELSTAMPKAGGDYYFVTRTLGPLSGTISGLFGWVAISLKSAFAIFGMAEVIYLLTGVPLIIISIVLCTFFVCLNIYGVQAAARFEVGLVLGLLGLMFAYIFLGVPKVEVSRFEPFMPQGLNSVMATAGFVFVSFGGLISVAGISEEVKNPKKNLPLGLIAAVVIVTIIYAILLFVTVGVLSPETFRGSLTPIADTARIIAGTPGFIALTFAAFLAFITTAIAGIMSASRYPMALSRDNLIPRFFSRVSQKFQTPVISLVFTGVFIIIALLLPLDILVKAASTVILTANIFANIAVIILRESRIQNYRPTFRAPLYPWLQILSIILFGFFIVDMGLATIEISVGMLAAAILVYIFYGRSRAKHEYALLHLFARITNKKMDSHNLESELRDIIHERDEIRHDRFDEYIKSSRIIDLECPADRSEFFSVASEILEKDIHLKADKIAQLLEEREKDSSTALSSFVAVPHIILDGDGVFRLLVARCKKGIRFSDHSPKIKAVFIIMGTRDERNLHLRALAAIAQIVQEKDFENKWLQARNENQLRDLLLLSDRRRTGAS